MQYADQHESGHELYRTQKKTNWVVSIIEKLEKKKIFSVLWKLSKFFRGWVLIVFSIVFSSDYRFRNFRRYSNKIGLAVITGVSTTRGEFSVIQFLTTVKTGPFFWYFSFVSIFNGVSWDKKFHWVWMCFQRMMDQRKVWLQMDVLQD